MGPFVFLVPSKWHLEMFPYLIMLNNYHRHVKEHPTLSPASTKFVSSSNQNTTPFLSFYVNCELSSTPNQSALALQERNCELPWQKAAFLQVSISLPKDLALWTYFSSLLLTAYPFVFLYSFPKEPALLTPGFPSFSFQNYESINTFLWYKALRLWYSVIAALANQYREVFPSSSLFHSAAWNADKRAESPLAILASRTTFTTGRAEG